MNPLTEFAPEVPTQDTSRIATREYAARQIRRSTGVCDEQIQGLVQQLFFRREPAVHHVGFTAIEGATETAQLCLDVAAMLAESGNHEVGLVDARLQTAPLSIELGLDSDSSLQNTYQLMPRLWLVPRGSWLEENTSPHIWDSSLARVRDAIVKFDHSIVALDPLTWLTARIGQFCDGLVLVVTANRTRRHVAAQVRKQLKAARVPILGAVLAERRFPIPEGLYRSL